VKHTTARAILFSAIFVIAAATLAAAQTPAPPTPAPAARPDATTADEDFELNIDQRRITETDFHAATEVAREEGEPGGLDLRVGAVVGASEIDVLLRNVRGRVRFRASLEPLLRLLDARRSQRPPK
jgi:hypothetical protein